MRAFDVRRVERGACNQISHLVAAVKIRTVGPVKAGRSHDRIVIDGRRELRAARVRDKHAGELEGPPVGFSDSFVIAQSQAKMPLQVLLCSFLKESRAKASSSMSGVAGSV